MLGWMPHQIPRSGTWARQLRIARPAARSCPPGAEGSQRPLPPVVRCTSQTSDVAELGTQRAAANTPTIWLCPDLADRGPIVVGGARFGAPAGSHHRVAWPSRSAPAPWEGPLVSESSELLSDASHAPAEAEGAPVTTRRRRTGTGLSAMVLPELQALASSLGISGTGRMRKSQLIAAIQDRQGQGQRPDGGEQGAPQPAATGGAPMERAPEMVQANVATAGANPSAPVETDRPAPYERASAPGRTDNAPEQIAIADDGNRPARDDQQTIAGEAAERDSAQDIAHDTTTEIGRDGKESRDGREGGSGRDGASGRDTGGRDGGRAEGGGREGGRQRQRNGRDRGEGRDGRDNREGRDNRGNDNRGGDRDQQQGQRRGQGGGQSDDDGEGGGRSRRGRRFRERNRLPAGSQRCVRFARPGPQERAAQGRRHHRRRPPAARGRAAGEVQRARAPGHRQRHGARSGQGPGGLHQADPAVPAGAPPPGERPGAADDADHRPGQPDRQGPARSDRLAAEGR